MVRLPYKNNPTIDIYFSNPLNDLIAKPISLNSSRPISRIGPNCFYANDKVVIIRYISDGELTKIRKIAPDHVFYLIDDDLHFLTDDVSLPEDYRNKLKQFSNNMLPKILDIANTIIAPNELILENYPTKEKHLLHPSFSNLCESFSHFDNPSEIKMVFTGTRSHISDLKMIKEEILMLCQNNPNVKLTTFMGKHAPQDLLNQHNIIHRNAQSWQDYQKIQRSERFHFALAPHLDTRFNRSRSINKIHDHAAFGAVGIYSDLSPLNQYIKDRQTGLLINAKTPSWSAKLGEALDNLVLAKRIAQAGTRLSETLGNPKIIRQFWLKELF